MRDRLRRGDHSLRRFCHAYDGRGGRGERRVDDVRYEGAQAREAVGRWLCGGLVHENRGGMFHETVLTACGKGRFAVTIKARMKARPAKVLSGGDGMSCEPRAVSTECHAHHAADIACVVRGRVAAS